MQKTTEQDHRELSRAAHIAGLRASIARTRLTIAIYGRSSATRAHVPGLQSKLAHLEDSLAAAERDA